MTVPRPATQQGMHGPSPGLPAGLFDGLPLRAFPPRCRPSCLAARGILRLPSCLAARGILPLAMALRPGAAGWAEGVGVGVRLELVVIGCLGGGGCGATHAAPQERPKPKGQGGPSVKQAKAKEDEPDCRAGTD